MYLVFASETDIDTALSLIGGKYKYQRLDGKWITPKPISMPSEMPTYTEESESLSWYSSDSKQYQCLVAMIDVASGQKLDCIEKVYRELKRKFTKENIRMGITQAGKTREVLEAFRDIDYAMNSGSVLAAFEDLDSMTRVDPFLSEARITQFKTELYIALVVGGVL